MGMVDRRILTPGATATPPQMARYLLRQRPAPDPAVVAAVVGAYWALGAAFGLDPAGLLAQCCVETDGLRFTGRVPASAHNVCGYGAINDGVSYATFPDWASGARAHCLHLLAWAGSTAGTADARYAAVRAAALARGWAHTWRDLGGRWAVGPQQDRYGDAIERHWRGILAEQGGIMQKPTVVSDPSPNRGYGGQDFNPEAIVWHISEGSEASAVSWLTNPASQASSNYLVGRTGTIHELVNPENGPDGAAWANGDVQQPDTTNALIAGWVKAGINPNRRTVSIESAGFTSNNQGGSLTPPQIDALVTLTAWLCQRFGIAPDQGHILAHYQLNNVTRHYCPGFSAAEWADWTGRVAALVAGGQPQPAPGPAPQPAPPANDPSGVAATILPDGSVEVRVNFGGSATGIQGVNYADLGVSVTGADGATYDRSIVAGAFQPWRKR